MLTFEMWVQRFIGAYMAFSGGPEEDAIEASKDFEPKDVDLEADCPVGTAEAAVMDDGAEDEPGIEMPF